MQSATESLKWPFVATNAAADFLLAATPFGQIFRDDQSFRDVALLTMLVLLRGPVHPLLMVGANASKPILLIYRRHDNFKRRFKEGVAAMDEGERWFHIEQDRKRELQARVRRAKRRVERAARREQTRQQGVNPKIRMQVSEWAYDENGVLTRTISAD
jgi:hypothetical protein